MRIKIELMFFIIICLMLFSISYTYGKLVNIIQEKEQKINFLEFELEYNNFVIEENLKEVK